MEGERRTSKIPRPGPRLLWEAHALLALIPRLRATGFMEDVAQLREKLASMLREFHARARRDGVEPTRVEQATEVLAALLDHVVTSMPWGVDAGWRTLGAVSTQSATERLLEVARRSFADAGMRELISVALVLGFEGNRGENKTQLNQLRAQLAGDAHHDKAQFERELAPQSQSHVERSGVHTSWLPLWVASAVFVAVLAVLFVALQLSLAAKSDRLVARVASLNAPVTQEVQAQPASQPRFAGDVLGKLSARDVQVRDEIDRSVFEVPGAQLFEAGSTSLRADAASTLQVIASALLSEPGRIQIVGHTGREAARSARYPSEWDLSVDRARVVLGALRDLGITDTRMTFDGRANPGDGERVEIVLLAGR